MSIEPKRPLLGTPISVVGPGHSAFVATFGDLLLSERLVEPSALSRGTRAAEATKERFDLVLVKLGLISEADLCTAYGKYCGLTLLAPRDVPDKPVLPERLQLPFLKVNRILPIRRDDESVLVATADPFSEDALAAVGYLLNTRVELAVMAPADIERALAALYEEEKPPPTLDQEIGKLAIEASEHDVERLRDIANEAPIIRLVNEIISTAVERGASDIHIEPGPDAVDVRYRVDGFLQLERSLPAKLRAALTSRVKIMAKLDIAERRLPHDGRIKTAVRGVEIDLRVSTLPSTFGESLVLRLLDRTRVELDFIKLGLSGSNLQKLHELMALPNGIILVTGPTGSGKTTTLYTALKHLNRPELKLFTVEDPVEYQLSGITQVQVQPQIGFDFPTALRSILRQDPDIVMIGEIRDLETARIAIQSALTGHLVFSTLHTNSAIAAVTRLIDIGIERYLLASTVSGVMAQRLVRKLCRVCSRLHKGGHIASHPSPDCSLLDFSTRREAVGCDACGNTGYSGRTTIAELLVIDDRIRERVGRRTRDQHSIEELAREGGFRSMYEDGLAKVAAGETTLEEVLRVTRAL